MLARPIQLQQNKLVFAKPTTLAAPINLGRTNERWQHISLVAKPKNVCKTIYFGQHQIIIAEPTPMATKTREKFYPGEDKNKLSDPETEAKLILKHILK